MNEIKKVFIKILGQQGVCQCKKKFIVLDLQDIYAKGETHVRITKIITITFQYKFCPIHMACVW